MNERFHFCYDIQCGSTIIFIAQREIDRMPVTKIRGCFTSPWVKKGSVPQLCIIHISISLVQSYNIHISVSTESIMKTDHLTFTEWLYMSRPGLLNPHPFWKSGNKWTTFLVYNDTCKCKSINTPLLRKISMRSTWIIWLGDTMALPIKT
jgi:hypothetical protein